MKLKKLKETNPDFEVMTEKQITKAVMKNTAGAYNPKSTGIMALAAMLLYSTINSVLITVVFRKVVFRQK